MAKEVLLWSGGGGQIDGEIKLIMPTGAYATAQEMRDYYRTGEFPEVFKAIEDVEVYNRVVNIIKDVRNGTQQPRGQSRRLIMPRRGRGKSRVPRGNLRLAEITENCWAMRDAHEADGMDALWGAWELSRYVVAIMDDDVETPNEAGQRYRVRYDALSSADSVDQWRNTSLRVPVWREETPWPSSVVEEI